MNDLDPSWRIYARLQAQSDRRSRADAVGWGIEASLDHLLAGGMNGDPSSQARTAAAAAEQGRARERYRTRLRLRYCDPREVNDPTTMLEDRIRLLGLFGQTNRSERKILLAIGLGHDSATIAGRLSVSPAAVRKKIDRLRDRLAA